MKDYNFFEIYGKKKSFVIDKKSPVLIGAGIFVLVLMVSIVLLGVNFYYTSQINRMAQVLDDIQTSSEFIEANQIQVSIHAMADYDKNAEIALDKFNQNNMINTEVLKVINSAIPGTVKMMSFNIDNTAVSAAFLVPDRKAASEMILNLKNTGIFDDVRLISVLANQEGPGFMAYLSCPLKVGDAE